MKSKYDEINTKINIIVCELSCRIITDIVINFVPLEVGVPLLLVLFLNNNKHIKPAINSDKNIKKGKIKIPVLGSSIGIKLIQLFDVRK